MPEESVKTTKISKHLCFSIPVLLILVPVTLMGSRYFGNRRYYLCSVLLMLYAMVPFFMSFEKETFTECSQLVQVRLPDGVKCIEDKAFYRCLLLKNISLPGCLTEIGKSAFYQCGFTSIELPESLEKIGDSAFLKCKRLEYIKVPVNVKVIEKWAFHGCDRLKTVEISHDPDYIGEWIINRSAKIRCHKGSKADIYCIENGFQVEYME